MISRIASIPASWVISIAPNSGTALNTGTVPICHAPAIRCGGKFEVHLELGLLFVAPPSGECGLGPEVTFVYIHASERTGATVEILVATPDREIDASCRKLVWDNADRVSEVESNKIC
jgi:hypothetical protein